MTAALKGKTIGEAEALFASFKDLLTSLEPSPASANQLGKLAAFSGVRQFPSRVKCATLAWHTLEAALHANDVASTE